MPRRLFSAAAAGALLLGLAACGDTTDGPVTAPPPDLGIAAPSDGGGDPAPSDGGGEQTDPSADAPDIPPPDPADYADMDENTPEGAEQAFRYYIAVLNWSRQTGNTERISELHSDSCTKCIELTNSIEDYATRGEYWQEASIDDVGTKSFNSSNYEVEIGYVFIIDEHVEPGAASPTLAQEWTGVAGMEHAEGSWRIDQLALKETGDEV